MELWQVLLILFVAVGCFILGRQHGYDSALEDITEIINRCEDMAQDGVFIHGHKDDEEDEA